MKLNKFLFKNKKSSLAFTLVELLVVISIIGVLTTVLMVNFIGSRERAKDSQNIQNLGAAKNALRLYYNDEQGYPDDIDDISEYMPNYTELTEAEDLDFTYTSNDSDSFIMTILLESGGGVDWGASQLNCGIGATEENVYMVCSL